MNCAQRKWHSKEMTGLKAAVHATTALQATDVAGSEPWSVSDHATCMHVCRQVGHVQHSAVKTEPIGLNLGCCMHLVMLAKHVDPHYVMQCA